MTYDPLDTDADGTVEADVDNTSIDTEHIDIDPVEIGNGATASYTDSVAIGDGASANSSTDVGIAIGPNVGPRHSSIQIGEGGSVKDNEVIIGCNVTAENWGHRVGIGNGISLTGGADQCVVGGSASASQPETIAIGSGVSVDTQGVARIGESQLVFSAVQDTIADADLNNSEVTIDIDETGSQFIIRAKESDGTVVTGTVGYS
jgi:hypothetical protein